jgi:hypothetical protein
MNKYLFVAKSPIGYILEFTNLTYNKVKNYYISNAYLIISINHDNILCIDLTTSTTTLSDQLIKSIKYKQLMYE